MTRYAIATMIAISMLGAIASARARAETVSVDSAEWLVANSDLIVRGKIIDVTLGPAAVQEPVWDRVTVRVTETLRGKKDDAIVFLARQPADSGLPTSALRQMQEKGVEALFFLARVSTDKKGIPAQFAEITLAPAVGSAPIDLTGRIAFALPNADFKTLTRADDLLKFVRAAAKVPRDKAGVKMAVLHAPLTSEAYGKFRSGGGVLITFPVNGELEIRGMKWLTATDLEHRTLGVRTLAYFKNDDNIRLMKTLLKSPDCEEVTGEMQQRYRVYPLRSAAMQALEHWGITVAPPIIQEPLPGGK